MISTKNVLAAVAGLLLTGTLVACASGGRNVLSWDLGQSTSIDAQEEALRIFRQHRYEIERHEEPPSIYIITRWRLRTPFPDEEEMGVVEARTRFILEARPRSRTMVGTSDREDPYSVRLRAVNEGRVAGGPGFTIIDTTPEFKEYADGLADELKTVLEMGIRVWGVGDS